jgi:hypothetical protein
MAGELDLSAAIDAAASDTTTSTNTSAAASAPASTPAPAAASQAATSAQGGAPAGQPAAGQPTQSQQAAEWTLRNQLSSLGFQGQYENDQAAWNALADRLRVQQQQNDQALRIAAYYQANRQQIEAALAAQRTAAAGTSAPAAQPAAGDNWWNAPEWKDEWGQFLQRDDKGNVSVSFGADPSLPIKYQQWQAFQRDQFNKLMRDPMGTLKPGIENLVKPMIEAAIKSQIQGYDDRNFAQSYVQGAKDWMYAKDQAGNPVRDSLTGQPILSPAGQQFAGYVQMAERMGITDTRQQQMFAEKMVQNDALTRFYQQHNATAGGNQQQGGQQQVPLTPEQQNEALKRQATRPGANRLPASGAQGGAGPAPRNGEQRSQDVRLSLGERLNKRLREAGVESIT